jgi:hypothetical protein
MYCTARAYSYNISRSDLRAEKRPPRLHLCWPLLLAMAWIGSAWCHGLLPWLRLEMPLEVPAAGMTIHRHRPAHALDIFACRPTREMVDPLQQEGNRCTWLHT